MDQILVAAIVVVIAILVIVGAVRIAGRRPQSNDHFGAGGRTTIPVGTHGFVKTALAPDGVVSAVGEDWSARSRTGEPLAVGTKVTIVGQDGLTAIVEAEAAPAPSAAGAPDGTQG